MTDSFVQIVCPSCHVINRVPRLKLNDHPLCGKCKNGLLSSHPIMANDQNFSRFIEKNDLPVVVDFWASWCGPCQQFAPVFSQVSEEMITQACFVKLDTENNHITASRYQIRSIPTLMIFHHGKEIARLSGALPKAQFKQWLQQNLST
ncbi:MAG: thioredoxin TrxC [Tolumonas sp.]|uniref:thioredoxin TrxC n=1 Tax=uncultured Tolumonas sp. TaxID=263765 RepID=UPI002A0A9375|nr:thioredoxin TrxC [uncultured Tolumonas sp.]MDD2343997.1 thioredoxin TrxC [Tolumonas sp.]